MASGECAGGAVIYTRRDLINAYLNVQRYQSADPALVVDSAAFSSALQQVFQIPLDELASEQFFGSLGVQAYLFKRGVEAIKAQDSGVLEEGLIYSKLEAQGAEGEKLSRHYIAVGEAQHAVTQQALKLLAAVLASTWPTAPETVTSEDLLHVGFNDTQRPDPMDYW